MPGDLAEEALAEPEGGVTRGHTGWRYLRTGPLVVFFLVRCGSHNHDLFVAEGDHGVYAGGAAGWIRQARRLTSAMRATPAR